MVRASAEAEGGAGVPLPAMGAHRITLRGGSPAPPPGPPSQPPPPTSGPGSPLPAALETKTRARRTPRPVLRPQPVFRKRRLKPKSPAKTENSPPKRRRRGAARGRDDAGAGEEAAAARKLTHYFDVEAARPAPAPAPALAPELPQPQGEQPQPQVQQAQQAVLQNKGNRKLTEWYPVRRSVRKTSKCMAAERARELEACVREWAAREALVRAVPVAGKGRGVVARAPFAPGDFVLEYAGELVSGAEARRRELRYASDPAAPGCYMYYFKLHGQQYCVDATVESARLGRLVNHARAGNLVPKAAWLAGAPRLLLLAHTHIRPGDELTYDYGDRSRDSIRHHPWLAL